MEIREASSGDWERYRAFRLRALRHDPQAFGSTLAVEEAFSAGEWRQRLQAQGEEASSRTWLMVDGAGRILGSIVAARDQGHFHVFAMWVDPESRRAGIGGQLLDNALEWMRRTAPGFAVELEVNPGQESAVRLYQSRGFRFTGVSRPIGHIAGVSVCGMVRKRDPSPSSEPK